MSDYALEFRGVSKRYGRRPALRELDLGIRTGTVTGLVGSNGAGKTTSLSIAGGIIRPTRGTVSLFGEGPFDPHRHAGRVSLLPQDALLPHVARVFDLLFFYARLQGMTAAEAGTEVRDVLSWVHLLDRAQSSIRTLSHGMRRRVTIAQAFLGSPELIILDEPLSGLDPREVVNIRRLLRERAGRQTILVSSHNLHEIELMCDHVAFIENGATLRQDSIAAVTQRRQVLSFVIEGGAVPEAALRDLLPGADVSVGDQGRRVLCRFGEQRSVAEVNRTVLECLFGAGIGVLEVQRGAGLEKAYLENIGDATEGTRPLPPPFPPAA